jgi:hypothetical protein
MKLTEYFDSEEFKCGDGCGLGHESVSMDIINIATKIRTELGEPITVNSSCRCSKHNYEVGGARHSRHLAVKGKCISDALDITARDFNKLMAVAKDMSHGGYTIIYINKRFVHIDCRGRVEVLMKWDI